MSALIKSFFTYLEQALAALSVTVPSDVRAKFTLEHPADSSHGDYATNVAMVTFGSLKNDPDFKQRFSNPRAFAEAVVDQLRAGLDSGLPAVSRIEVAGPGFINFFLSDAYFWQQLQPMQDDSEFLRHPDWVGKKVMIEFTDPNPFKQLHIGHAYSNSVGESISRLIEAVGAEVCQACYQGDVGMHVAKTIWGLLDKVETQDFNQVKDQLETWESSLSKPELAELLGQAYAAGATAYEDDESVKEQVKNFNYLTYLSAQQRLVEEDNWEPQVDYQQFVEVQSAELELVKLLYQTGRRWSMEYFEDMYGLLGMRQKESGKYFDHYYAESIVGEYGLKIVKEFLAKGIFKESNGAVIFPGSEYGLHDRVFVNSLGLPTYEAKELGLAPEKFKRFPYDKSIIITGNEIDEYFKVLLTALGQIRPDLAEKTTHMSHGMVRLPEGKMSSRTGNVLTAQWLLEEAAERINQVFETNELTVSEAERQAIAHQVGLAAIKYAFLKHSVGGDIAFDFDESLSFSGQSGPYLQYTYVRCQSILDKAAAEKIDFDSKQALIVELSKEERSVVRLLAQFGEVVHQAAVEFSPHMLAHYLFSVAQAYSVFYAEHQVLQEPDTVKRAQRLTLTAAMATTLKQGLFLLGINTVAQM